MQSGSVFLGVFILLIPNVSEALVHCTLRWRRPMARRSPLLMVQGISSVATFHTSCCVLTAL